MSHGFKLVESDVWPGCRQIEEEGELDLAVSARLHAALARAEDECRHVLLDLGHCELIDASGLAVLVAGSAGLSRRGRQLLLLDVHGQVRRLLALTGLAGEQLRIGPNPDGTRYRGADDAAALIPG
jgi:anti-anti-sigma factor